MKELNKNELIDLVGGHVPTAFFMDNDVIKANVAGTKAVVPLYVELLKTFGYEIMKFMFL